MVFREFASNRNEENKRGLSILEITKYQCINICMIILNKSIQNYVT